MKKKILFLLIFASFLTYLFSRDYSQIPRISYVKGNVQIEDVNGGWSNCDLNIPITEGSRIVTGDDGRVEVEFDDGSALRADSDSEFFISILDPNYVKIETVSGTFILKTISDVHFEIVSPVGNIFVKRPSTVRIDEGRNGILKVFVRDGKAIFRNEFIDKKIGENRGIYIFNGGREYSKLYSKELDNFDFWSDRRDSRYSYSQSTRYIHNSSIYIGIYDLDHYGRWVFLNDFGYCWVPAIYDVEWAPYRYGYWRYCSPWGWTWVSYEPWGWLPYHYGRWYFESSFGWVWIPGSHWSISYWSPGLVRFSIWDNYIGWVPLGPGDYYCYDCGWNRDITIVNNYTNVNYYNLTNLHVRNAATIVDINDFRRGRPVRINKDYLNYTHRPYMPRPARTYIGNRELIGKVFSRNKIVKTKLSIKPIVSRKARPINISEVRRNFSRRGGGNLSTGRSYNYRRNRGNYHTNSGFSNINRDISKGRNSYSGRRNYSSNGNRYTPVNSGYNRGRSNREGGSYRENSGRNRNSTKPVNVPYSFHRENNQGKKNSGSGRRMREYPPNISVNRGGNIINTPHVGNSFHAGTHTSYKRNPVGNFSSSSGSRSLNHSYNISRNRNYGNYHRNYSVHRNSGRSSYYHSHHSYHSYSVRKTNRSTGNSRSYRKKR